MGSWSEELARREAAARERTGSLRRLIAELAERLAAGENLLSRLEITRETMTEILAGAGKADEPDPRAAAGGEQEGGAAVGYLTGNAAFLRYDRALAAGWPIATGVIEGACRHLIADRLGISGARWGWPEPKPSSSSAP